MPTNHYYFPLIHFVPKGRLELPPLTRLDFESSASTISPLGQPYKILRIFILTSIISLFYRLFGKSKEQSIKSLAKYLTNILYRVYCIQSSLSWRLKKIIR